VPRFATVVANDEVLQADKIFINVGGRASVPPIPGIHDVSFLTNSSVMDVDFLPEHLVIIGGSYVGLEFGQMYRRFGSEVTIVEMGSRRLGVKTKIFPKPCAKFWGQRGYRFG
jgi:pyruvate/2-oxoglutarate dehydrogenase complex dihydrolipoamide dehydrogenase (E3) component